MPSPTGAKTLALLDLLARHPAGLSSTEAARKSDLTANLVFRILKTFVAMGYATQRGDDKVYVLSSRLLELSRPNVGEQSLVVCAMDTLRALRDETGETVQLLIEAGGKAFVLEQVRGTQALQVSGQVGMRIPLYSCAPGKTILAGWNDPKREAWFRDRTLQRFTARTLSRRKDLEGDLAEIRIKGYAVDRAEGIAGIHCVAAAIRDDYAQPVAAVTVMAPIGRLPESAFAQMGARCMAAARAIEHRLRL